MSKIIAKDFEVKKVEITIDHKVIWDQNYQKQCKTELYDKLCNILEENEREKCLNERSKTLNIAKNKDLKGLPFK